MLKKGAKIGEYTLLNYIGSGGFADVWKAEKKTALDVNYFALKFFRPNNDGVDFDKVRKEINVWKQLKGLPHIISVTELDQFEDYVYVVSDFAEGGSLEDWLKANDGKASSIEEAIKITSDILVGLENLHEKGFVHRDLKPDNVVILNNKHCLTDFGITRQMKSHSKATGTAGTFEYMPPEAFDKKPSISVETDLWAVGVILQQLLTGKLPYPQEDQPSLIAAILMSEPESLPNDIPDNIKAFVKKALQKNRDERFKSAKEMRYALLNPKESFAEKTKAKAVASSFVKGAEDLPTDKLIHPELNHADDSIHINQSNSESYFNRNSVLEKLSSFDDSNADYKAQIISQSVELNSNPNLGDAIKKMQEECEPEMKKYMEKVSHEVDTKHSTIYP